MRRILRNCAEYGRQKHVVAKLRDVATRCSDLLAFMQSCGKTRKGHFTVLRQTMRQRWQAKLRALKEELRCRLHTPISERGAYLRPVLSHFRYYGAPMNGPALSSCLSYPLERAGRAITSSASRSTCCLRSRALISRLNTRPVRPPVNASTPPSRAAPHDSGPLWFATPSTYETLIHYTLPVLTGARRTRWQT